MPWWRTATKRRSTKRGPAIAHSRRRRGPLPPLFGVPCSIKECFALAGMPQSAGAVSRRDFRASADAPAVARPARGGAIPIGVTNTSELCMWMESNNRLYGRTRNPYDPSRIAVAAQAVRGRWSGSAPRRSGSAATSAAPYGCPPSSAESSDTSRRRARVPNDGQHPTMPRASGCSRRGPRTSRRGPLAAPAGARRSGRAPGDPAAVSLEGLRVLDVASNGRLGVSRELRAAQMAAAGRSGEGGRRCRPSPARSSAGPSRSGRRS